MDIVAGTILLCVPLPGARAVGASMLGAGLGGIAGGYAAEAMGGSFETGAAIGSIVGAVIGGSIYRLVQHLRPIDVAKMAQETGKVDEAMQVYNDFDIDSAYVKPKHLSTTGGGGAKFIGDSKAEAEAVLKAAMRNGNVVSYAFDKVTPMGNIAYKYVVNAGQIVGTKGQTHIFLVLSNDGGMLTAYPKTF